MMPGLTFHVSAVELMQTLKCDDTTLLGAELCGDLLPSSALLTQFADEADERFQPAVKGGASATPGRRRVISGFRIHHRQFKAGRVSRVSEQWAG